MSANATLSADCLAPGRARGELVCLSVPLSLWGGFDLESGAVCDVNHPQHGTQIAGKVIALPGGRGSSSSSSVLLESARLGINPLAIILTERDPILAVGALVADDLYGVSIPIVRISIEKFHELTDRSLISVTADPGNACIDLL